MSTGTARRSVDRYNEGVRELAERDELLLIDFDRAIPKDVEHFIDDCHLTPRGHAAAAEAIVQAVLASGLLPGAG